jgi:hypothetical protein
MRLVEIVQCKNTSVKASQAALGVAKRLGKVGVLVRTVRAGILWGGFFSLMAAVYLCCSCAEFRLVKYGEVELFLISLQTF